MDPNELARIHALCFDAPRPWSSVEMSALLDDPLVIMVESPHGFALARSAGPEGEVLTIAVLPEFQNRGSGGKLLGELLSRLHGSGATELFLEVAENNAAAIKLYKNNGFSQVGIRKNYYRQSDGRYANALVMKLFFDH